MTTVPLNQEWNDFWEKPANSGMARGYPARKLHPLFKKLCQVFRKHRVGGSSQLMHRLKVGLTSENKQHFFARVIAPRCEKALTQTGALRSNRPHESQSFIRSATHNLRCSRYCYSARPSARWQGGWSLWCPPPFFFAVNIAFRSKCSGTQFYFM